MGGAEGRGCADGAAASPACCLQPGQGSLWERSDWSSHTPSSAVPPPPAQTQQLLIRQQTSTQLLCDKTPSRLLWLSCTTQDTSTSWWSCEPKRERRSAYHGPCEGEQLTGEELRSRLVCTGNRRSDESGVTMSMMAKTQSTE